MGEIASDILGWINKFLDASKQSRTAKTPASSPDAPDSPASDAPDPDAPAGSALAGEIRAAIDNGGINIAIYMIGHPDKNNDKEFKRQAIVWAGNHGAFGMSGSTPKKNHAMALSEDPGKLVTGLLDAMSAELGTGETIPIANVALFSHGGSKSIQVDSKGEGGGEKWASAGSSVIKNFAAAVKPALTAGAKIHLFACNAAMDRDPTKDSDDATRTDSFAEALQELTGAEVWGHENAAHTTGNSRLVQVTDTNDDANAERYQIRDVLSRKFMTHVDPYLTDAQMGYLDQKLDISSWIKNSIRFRGKGTKQLDRHQVFVEEISMMGFDELFDMMIADSPPGESVFRSLFPEHDQIDKLVEGAAAVHAQFHKELEAKTQAIANAKSNADFPSDEAE